MIGQRDRVDTGPLYTYWLPEAHALPSVNGNEGTMVTIRIHKHRDTLDLFKSI